MLKEAHKDSRVLLTFDKDFGTLTFREETLRAVGAVQFRLPPLPKDLLVRFAVETVRNRNDWVGHFTVIEQHQSPDGHPPMASGAARRTFHLSAAAEPQRQPHPGRSLRRKRTALPTLYCRSSLPSRA